MMVKAKSTPSKRAEDGSPEPPAASDPCNATVIMRHEFTHGLLMLRVKPDSGPLDFKPGQYTVLGLPGSAPRSSYADPEDEPADPDKMIKRAYSVASSSLQGEYLEFYVAMVRSGALSPRLFALHEGDRVWLGPKISGMFTLDDVPEGNDVVLVATGTGLAPYLSMLRSAYEFDANRTTIVGHAARVSWDLGYRQELESLAARYPNFHYLPIIDEVARDPEWKGEVGFVNRFVEEGTFGSILERDFSPETTSVFLCGNPLMIKSMMETLEARGFTKHSRRNPGSIFVEEYWKD
jgi:ferredoxin--NADP+ reductase